MPTKAHAHVSYAHSTHTPTHRRESKNLMRLELQALARPRIRQRASLRRQHKTTHLHQEPPAQPAPVPSHASTGARLFLQAPAPALRSLSRASVHVRESARRVRACVCSGCVSVRRCACVRRQQRSSAARPKWARRARATRRATASPLPARARPPAPPSSSSAPFSMYRLVRSEQYDKIALIPISDMSGGRARA